MDASERVLRAIE